MPLPHYRSGYSFAYLVALAIGLACLTSWATLTGYTAKQNKSSDSAHKEKTSDRLNGVRTAIEDGSVSRAKLNKAYGNLPLSFEANRGQTDASVNYLARGPGYNIFLTPAEAVLVFRDAGKDPKEADAQLENPDYVSDVGSTSGQGRLGRLREGGLEQSSAGTNPTVVKMRFDGANTGARAVEGTDELPGKVNYFLGNDSSKWITNIPTYSKVTYHNVYSGVDLVYYGNRQQLEYDLVVAPGADPSVVAVKFEGVKDLKVDRDGNLVLKTEAGQLQQQKPLVYQEENGARKLIEGRYVMRGRKGIGFRVSRYDRRKPLVIDPRLAYLSLVNGGGDGYAIAVDSSGFAYITGTITSSTLNPTTGAYQIAFGGVSDAFVTKLNQTGDGVVYSTYLGGSSFDEAYGIAVDSQGNAYVTGYGAAGFPTTAGAYQTGVRGGFYDCFVAKLNSSGSGLIYSTFYGGNQFEEGDGIAIDSGGNAYVAGSTLSTDLVTSPGARQATNAGGYDGFAIKLNSAGSALLYGTYFGGGGGDIVNGAIALDTAGNAYVSGQTSSLNFPQVNSILGAAGFDRGLFKSSNAGSNWTLSRNGLASTHVHSLAIDRNTPTIIYAGTTGKVSKSTDGGANWADTGPTSGNVQALAIDPSNSSIVYAGTIQGVYKTTNAGGSWANSLFTNNVQALAIDPITPTTIYAGNTARLSKSTNGGSTWFTTGLTSGNVRSIIVDPSLPTTVYAATLGGVLKSTNGGTTWTAFNSGLGSLDVRCLAIVPNAPSTIYAGTAAGVSKTTNGGTTWITINSNLLLQYTDNVNRTPAIAAIAIDPVTPTTLYAAPNNGTTVAGGFPLSTIFKSTDGGASWTGITNGFNALNNGFLSLAIDPSNPSTIYAGNNGDFDGFLIKLNPTASALVYSTYISGGRSDFAAGVALDVSNSAYVVGYTQSVDFPTTPGAFQTSLKGFSDVFVTKVDPSGSSFSYSTYLGGTTVDRTLGGIAVDTSGSAYLAGFTSSTDFPVTPGAFQTTIGNPGSPNVSDEFVTRLNPAGTSLVYSSYLGGGGTEFFSQLFGTYLALDPQGNAYVTGNTSSPTTFPYFFSVNGFGETYVAKIESSVSSFSITGRLLTTTSTPIAGAFVELSNGQGFFRGGVSDSQGFYSFISLPAGDYTVTPNKYDGSGRHYLYAPPTRTFVGLNSDQTANFTGTQVYDIQGQVTSSTVPGLGVFDVSVTLSGAASASTITDANGLYSFRDLVAGNYTVTPSKPSFTFNPVNRTFTNLNADQGADFTTASTVFFTVSGHVADQANTSISNVVISMVLRPQRGYRPQSAQTDANGNYSFPNLQSGGNYTFLASKPLFSFTPQIPTFPNLSANQTLNFLAAPVTGLVGKIAFASGQGGINVMNADTTGETTVTNNAQSPAWSPDGSKIAFVSNRDAVTVENFADLYVMNADGTGVTRLTNSPFEDAFPSWSPDQRQLTYSYGNLECSSPDFGSQPEVFVINADGSSSRNLTNTVLPDGISDWSPGGSSIAFVRLATGDCSGGEGNIYAMDSGGGNERLLANSPDGEFGPVYSPDGSRIAYVRENFDPTSNFFNSTLYVMNADGTGQTKIGPDFIIQGEDRPTWSPDGTKIAFSGSLPGLLNSNQIYVVNADGTGFAQLTSGANARFDPSWQHYSISGHLTGNASGLPITMALAGTLTRVTQTDANGNYVFGNLTPGGNYSVSPVSTAFGFNPAKTDINNLVGNQIANFAVLPQVIPTPTPALADNFAGAQRDPAKWNLGTQTQPLGAFDAQIPVVQQNGQLIVTPRTQTDGLHYNGYVSVNSFDFNNSTATVEVAQTATNGADTIFSIGSDLDNFSRFVVRDGAGAPGVFKRDEIPRNVAQLIFQVKAGGQLTSVSIPYDPVQHRFMRFRHEPPNNSIAFETSPDNVDFTVQKEIALAKGVSALTTELSAGTSSPTNPGQAVFDNFQLVTNTVQFTAPSFSVGEGQGSATLTVTRSGSVSTPVTVDYISFDDSAHQSSKYILATGSLSFAAGETTKSLKVLIIDNSLVEGNQTLYLNLTDSLGAGLNSPGRTALTIVDNDTTPPTTNPLDNRDALFFVREHYYDFLNREPDPSGFAFWADQITSCGTDQGCIEVKRINVSAAFFLSIEFQETGYLVYRFYNSALDRPNNLPRYLEFVRDTQTIGRGVVVGAQGWEAQLEANKVAYADKFVARTEFTGLYPLTLTPTQYVDALYAHALIVPSAAERQAAIAEFNNPTGARGRALRRVAENQTLYAREFNRAFVLAQYFGYLRRNPNDPPDSDFSGYNFWLSKLNQFNGNFVDAEMVKSFIVSGEYRGRFGP